MNISELSIRRPVLSTVLTIIILLFGLIGYNYLGVREYPSVDNPIISVSCSYPGANADVIENQITEPLEQNINGIPGIRSLSSVSQQGQSRITVEFELSVDLETAANDVRDKVSRAQRYLPRDCDPPTVSKADADATPILMVALQSDKRSLLELSEIADLTVKEQLQTISDVSSVSIWGEKRYSMRLWLDPIKMSGYGITPIDVKNAVDKENVELPSGSIEGNTTELTIRTLGLMHTAEEFNNLIVKEENDRIIRFSDIGRAELGPADIKSYMKMNGVPMVGIVVIPQPGANHIKIADAVYERMEKMQKDLPEDVKYSYGFDNTKFIRASISEVKETVYVAFILVIIIIFLFLRDWRVTLVPCIVIPVSLIGAFFVMYLADFSINVLSMLAVVLAVGLVVDDAIVMTENIYVRIEKGMPPKEAGIEGAKEIFFAVISTTITLVAVFFPIVFMEGMTGKNPYKFVITGRTKHFINAFGEELIVDNAEKGLAKACAETGAQVSEYSAAPVFMDANAKCRHQWLIEFAKMPDSIEKFAMILDATLKEVNSDYEAKRWKDIALQPLEVIVARKGLFHDWLAKKGKLGGQHKVPRLSNTRDYIEEMIALNER
uniref:efflux RND transporter permease subunit n=1 Tax=Bacteroides fragilis TaxID=817 RepID=UPI0009B9CAC4|nr:efflux RND transporter permease subunit [Bacteroides fragilis]